MEINLCDWYLFVTVLRRHGHALTAALLLSGLAALSLASQAALASKHSRPHVPFCVRAEMESFEFLTPAPLSTPLDPNVVAMYDVLRRPAGPQDSPPLLNSLGPELTGQLRGYYAAYVRRLAGDPDGEGYFLIPGLTVSFKFPPARCVSKRLRRKLPRLIAERRAREQEPIYCIVTPRRQPYLGYSSPTADCEPFTAVTSGTDYTVHEASSSKVIQLVPDGVATVHLSYRGGEAIEAAVSDNAFSYKPPHGPIKQARKEVRRIFQALSRHLSRRQGKRLERKAFKTLTRVLAELEPTLVQWLGPHGEVLRTLHPRSSGPLLGLDPVFVESSGIRVLDELLNP
jgi:hypothetical protein